MIPKLSLTCWSIVHIRDNNYYLQAYGSVLALNNYFKKEKVKDYITLGLIEH